MGILNKLSRLHPRDPDICCHTIKMITPWNPSHLLIIGRAAVTGIDDYRLTPYPPAQNLQHIQKTEIQNHPFAAGTLEFIQ